MVTIYTDGSSRGNPGPGGYGSILMSGSHIKELSKGFRLTTNNRMELMSVIAALEALTREKCDVTVYSDSKYVVDAIEQKWLFGWEKKNFKDKKNEDLWRRFLKVYRKHNVRFKWVRGHDGNEFNEKCDVLATAAADGNDLGIDAEYEKLNS